NPVREIDSGLPVSLDGVEVSRRRSEARSWNYRDRKKSNVEERCGGRADRARADAESARRQRYRDAPGVYQSARCAAVSGLREHHGAQRFLLQVHELRHHERVLVSNSYSWSDYLLARVSI